MDYYQDFSDYYDVMRGNTEADELVEVKPKEVRDEDYKAKSRFEAETERNAESD